MKGEAFRPVGGNSTGTFDANPYAPFGTLREGRRDTCSHVYNSAKGAQEPLEIVSS